MDGITYLILGVLFGTDLQTPVAQPTSPATSWSLNATIIAACSCPMFCQCYFNTRPAGHAGHGGAAEHFCRANEAYKINNGHYGSVSLDGLKFWIAEDLGEDFSQMNRDWREVTFEPGTTRAQREAVTVILAHVYPVKWRSFAVGEDSAVSWQANRDRAEARLGAGSKGEIVLNRYPGMTADPIVISNLKFFGAPRNDGFILMPNVVEAYRAGSKPFEFRGTNGLMITIDISSADVK